MCASVQVFVIIRSGEYSIHYDNCTLIHSDKKKTKHMRSYNCTTLSLKKNANIVK